MKPVTYSSSEGVASREVGGTLEAARGACRILRSKGGSTKSQTRAEEGAGVKASREEAADNRHKVGVRLYHLTGAFAAEVLVTDIGNVGVMPLSGRKLAQFVSNVTIVFLSSMTQHYAYGPLEHKLKQMRVTHKGTLGIRRQTGAARLHP